MRCPFPPCEWVGLPNEYMRAPGSTETNTVMPLHDVEGPSAWFGRCPASNLLVPELTEAGRGVLRDGMKYYARRVSERVAEQAERDAADREKKFPGRRPDESLIDYYIRRADERRAKGLPDEEIKLPKTDGIADLIRKGAARVDPRVKPDDYFPGRPADDPEPGLGEPPAQPVPPHANVTPLGKAGQMDNARDNLSGLIAACVASLDSVLEDLLRLRGQIEHAQTMLVVADETAVNTQQLMNITVGAAGSNLPEVARNMTAMMALGRTTMIGRGDQSVTWSLDAAREAATAAISQITASKSNAEQYLALPR